MIPESASSWPRPGAKEGYWDTNTNVLKLHDSTKTSQHATRDPTTRQQGWRSGLVSPWRLDHTRGSRQDIHSARVPITMMARNHHNRQANHCALKHIHIFSNRVSLFLPCIRYGSVPRFLSSSILLGSRSSESIASVEGLILTRFGLVTCERWDVC